jgi:septal ring factor EnvC (AmiA/AmiB activator)
VTEGKKKGPFSFLTDLISDEVPDKPAGPPRNTPLPPPPPGHVQAVQAGFVSQAPDPKSLASLEARLTKDVPPAYAAFMEMFQSLAEDIPDEAKRVKVALKTSKTTAVQIAGALDQLVGVMEVAHQEFNHSLEEQVSTHQALEDSIQAKRQQLAHLQEEVNALSERAATDLGRIERVKAGFEAAHTQVVSRLQAQKARIASMA